MTTTNNNINDNDKPLSFEYGESTSNPIAIEHVQLQVFDASITPSWPLPCSFATLTLSLQNKEIPKDISAKMTLALPLGASVKRFELQKENKDNNMVWFPATAIPKKKAKEVVYKEKEANRSVAVTETVAAAANLFSMEVSPLPHEKTLQCRLEILLDNDNNDNDAMTAFCQAIGKLGNEMTSVDIVKEEGFNITPMIVEKEEEKKDNSMDTDTVTATDGTTTSTALSSGGGAVVGQAFGKKHFVCQIPPIDMTNQNQNDNSTDDTTLDKVAILWDTSASLQPQSDQMAKTKSAVVERLIHLFQQAKTTTVELHTFHATAQHHETFTTNNDKTDHDWTDLKRAIQDLEYDGGSFLANLPQYLVDQQKANQQPWNAIIVVSDGVDNLGNMPSLDLADNSTDAPLPPVHCVAISGQTNGAINLNCLQALAALSHIPGQVIMASNVSNYYNALASNHCPRLISITTDQDIEAFTGEVEDGFVCVPDHRLAHFRDEHVDPANGLRIAGILGDNHDLPLSVTKLTAKVAVGNEIHEYHFELQPRNDDKNDGDNVNMAAAEKTDAVQHALPTLYLSNNGDGDETMAHDDTDIAMPNRMLGHLYAQKMYDQVQKDGLKSGMDMTKLQEELSATYGFCSAESSLLLLYEAEQFLDHGILPPLGHPVRGEVQDKMNQKSQESDKEENEQQTIGGPKTSEQLGHVQLLAKRLDKYFATPYKKPTRGDGCAPRSRLSGAAAPESRRGGGGFFARLQSRRIGGAINSEDDGEEKCEEDGPFDEEGFVEEDGGEEDSGGVGGEQPERGRLTSRPAYMDEANDMDEALNWLRSSSPAPMEEEQQPTFASLASLPPAPLPRGHANPQASLAAVPPPSASQNREGQSHSSGEADESLEELEEALRGLEADTLEEEEEDESAESAQMEAEMDAQMEAMMEEAATQNLQLYRVLSASAERKKSKKKKSSSKKRKSEKSGSSAVENAAKVPKPAVPTDPEKYMKLLEEELKSKDVTAWKKLYNSELKAHGGLFKTSPSFFLNTARVVGKLPEHTMDALRIASNCLETGLDDVQLLRSVAYLLLSIDDCLSEAAAIFDHVRSLAPCEPHSFLDSALARFLNAWRKFESGRASPSELRNDIVQAQDFVAKVLTTKWADRFAEIEWPCIILLHYIAQLVSDINASNPNDEAQNLVEWPTEQLKVFQTADEKDPLRSANFDLSLCVWLAWDTDKTDVDLHVKEPSGTEVYYSNKEGDGSMLSRDFTQGYGPEVYILKSSAAKHATAKGNKFEVFAKYYASHQDSKLTGTTSCCVWTIEKKKDGKKNHVQFNFVRLNTNKQNNLVTTAEVKHGSS